MYLFVIFGGWTYLLLCFIILAFMDDDICNETKNEIEMLEVPKYMLNL